MFLFSFVLLLCSQLLLFLLFVTSTRVFLSCCFNFSFHGFTQCRNIKYILMRNLIYWGFPSCCCLFFENLSDKFSSSAVRIYWRFISFSLLCKIYFFFLRFFFLFFVIMTLIKSMCSFWDTNTKKILILNISNSFQGLVSFEF